MRAKWGSRRATTLLFALLASGILLTSAASVASGAAHKAYGKRHAAVKRHLTAASSADLDQCANGGVGSTPLNCDQDAQWVNGNLGASKAHYLEGDSIPYRLLIGGVTTGTDVHTVTIQWDTTKSGKHAIDYLTSYNRTVTGADPCAGVSGCSSAAQDTAAIPADPQVTGAGVTQVGGVFTLFNGHITGVSAYSHTGDFLTGDSSASITISFTADSSDLVLAWAGHIASRADWGMDNAAVSISGSPYHMRLLDLDGSGGNQDRSLSEDAVIFPGSITIVKDATPNGSTSFPFTASPAPLSNFSLVDDGTSANTKTFSNITTFGTYTVTEGAVAAWSFDAITCSVTSANGGSVNTSGTTATIDLHEGENRTCTYTNHQQTGTLLVKKHVVNDNGGNLTAANFTLHVKSGGTDVSGSPQPGSETGTSYALPIGTYTVSEDAVAGYAQTSIVCDGVATNSVTLANGDSKTCTITNDDVAPTLTVIKHVVNNNGGSASASAWTMHIKSGSSDAVTPFAGAESPGTTKTLSAGSYVVSESGGPSGYALTFSGDCDSSGAVTLGPGDNKTCTLTNDDIAATLTVIKHVVNDNGGTASASAWSMHITSGGSDVSGSPFPGAESPGTTKQLSAGSYVVSESGGPSGYAATVSGDCNSSTGAVTLGPGDNKTCTITNNDIAPTLTVIKHVVNDDGGSASASAWTMHVKSGTTDAVTPFAGAESPGTTKTLSAGSYTVSESGGPSGYALSFSGDCDSSGAVTLGPGQNKTCTLTNNDVAPTLTVIKHVVNDNGGTASASAWTMHIKVGSSDAVTPFAGAESPGTTKQLSAGGYTVSESGGPSGYAATISGACDPNTGSVTLNPGDSKTCTITNNDIAPTLTVIKHVLNDDGGTASASAWSMHISSGGSDVTGSPFPGAESPGTSKTLSVGSYVVSESGGPSGYAATLSGDCNSSTGAVTLGPGDSKTCTITNNDIAPTLTVTKVTDPTNDTGSFNLRIDDVTKATGGNGTTTGPVAVSAGAHKVSETGDGTTDLADYVAVISGDCASDGTITLSLAQNASCTITNTLKAAPTVTVKKVCTNGAPASGTDKFEALVGGHSTDPKTILACGDQADVTLAPKTAYSITEGAAGTTDLGNYNVSYSDGCSNETGLPRGSTGTICTITNELKATPKVTVTKLCPNGTAGGGDRFQVKRDGTNIGDPLACDGHLDVTVTPGHAYSITEGAAGTTDLANYTTTYSEGCSGTLAHFGDTATCTITNTLKPAPILIVIKNVINDNGGQFKPSNFTLSVTGSSPAPASFPGDAGGTVVTLLPGAYSVHETPVSGYATSMDAGCTGTLAHYGDKATCTVTNNDIAPPPPPPPAQPSPKIDLVITKVANPNPVTLGDNVTYTLKVTNKGPNQANNVVVTDSLPSETTFISVATDKGTCTGTNAITCNLGQVAVGEIDTITIVVKPTVTGTITNTAVVAGNEQELDPSNNRASATVTVNGPFTPPSVCYALTVRPTSLTVGHRTIVHVKVRQGTKPVSGVRVVIVGKGISKASTTNSKGVATFVIRSTKPGILQIRVPTHATCRKQRIGVIGVFTPPVTG